MDELNLEIIQMEEKILNAFNSGNVKEITLNYAKEAKMFPQNGIEIQGINRIAAYWRITINSGVNMAGLDSIRIWKSGSTAFEIGKYWLYENKGKLADFGDYQAIWRNKYDEWKLYLHQWITGNPEEKISDLSTQINKAILGECELSNMGCSYITFDAMKCDSCLY